MSKISTLIFGILFCANAFTQDSTALQIETGIIKYGLIPTPTGSNLRINGSSWTLEAWVYVPSSPSPQQMFVIETYSGTATGGFVLRINSTYKLMAYQIANPSSSVVVNGATDVSFGAWNHIAATYNAAAQTLNVYLNGVLDGTVACTLPSYNINDNLNIGARGDDSQIWQTITIDEVRIWNVARSQSQIAASMNLCLAGDETGLLAYYSFEGQTDQTILDETANNNDGSIPSFASTVLVDGVFDCVGNTLSVNEASISNIEIYPNPAHDYLNVNTSENILAIELWSADGKLIKTENEKLIQISDLNTGVYIITVKTTQSTYSQKFIKQ